MAHRAMAAKQNPTGGAQDRVTLETMRTDPNLTRTCYMSAVALMGFDTLEQFGAYVAAAEAWSGEMDDRVKLALAWSSDTPSSPVNFGQVDGLEQRTWSRLMVGNVASIANTDNAVGSSLAAEWSRPLNWYPGGSKTTKQWKQQLAVFGAIRPCLKDISDTDATNVDVSAIALIARNGESENTWGKTVDAFTKWIELARDRGVAIDDLADLIGALVWREASTVNARLGAYRAAVSCYPAVESQEAVERSNLRELAACENLTFPLGADAWGAWIVDQANQLAEGAFATLGFPHASELDIAKAVAFLREHIGTDRMDMNTRASDHFVEFLISRAQDMCLDAQSSLTNVQAVHEAIAKHIAEDSGQTPELAAYMAFIRSSDWYGASGEFLRQEEKVINPISARIGKKRVQFHTFPDELWQQPPLQKFEGLPCRQRREALRDVRAITTFSEIDKASEAGARKLGTADFVSAYMKPVVLAKLVVGVKARYKDPARMQAALTDAKRELDNIPLPPSNGASVQSIIDYLKAALRLIDSINPVRVVLTIRTVGYDKDAHALTTVRNTGRDVQALAIAQKLVSKNALETDWYDSMQQIALPLAVAPVPNTRATAGPFHTIMLNGARVRETVEDNVSDILASIKRVQSGGSPLHYVYSAYGLSGSGKTKTLMVGEGSVLQTIVQELGGPNATTVLDAAGVKASVAVTDVYGENEHALNPESSDEDKGAGLCANTMTPRNYLVSYALQAPSKMKTLVRGTNYKKVDRAGEYAPFQSDITKKY